MKRNAADGLFTKSSIVAWEKGSTVDPGDHGDYMTWNCSEAEEMRRLGKEYSAGMG